ncbi:MAG: amidohydrolase, partial [Bacilli bacterium]
MENKIKEIVNQNFEELVALREHLHRNPELSNQEYKTQQLIIDFLSKLTGVEVHKTAETGVVAIIKGKKEFYPNPVIALRADIDALAIQDEK